MAKSSLLLLALGAAGLYVLQRNLFGGGGSALSLAQQAAIANAQAAGGVLNYLWPPQGPVLPAGAMNNQGFPPPANDPYYAAWLAQAAGYPGVVGEFSPGAATPIGTIFEQFSPAPSPAYYW